MPPRLVIFDCDGVLVDSEPISNRIIAEAITAAGLPVTAEAMLRRYRGGKLTVIRREVEAELGRALDEEWVADLYRRQFAAFERELRVIPGIEAAIERVAAAGALVCVGSNGPPHKMAVTLALTGLERHFTGRIFSADMVARPKPAPDLYLYCAERMGVAAADCAVVEDSATGVRAAIAAGMRVIGYGADSGEAALRAAGADVTLRDMAGLPACLGLDTVPAGTE